jgi:hypothetical protein
VENAGKLKANQTDRMNLSSSFQKGDCSFRKKNSPPFEIPLRKGWLQSRGFIFSFAPLVLSLYDAPNLA